MKTTLTIEQSQQLIELGVNPYLASNEVTEKHPITENEIPYPIFTLADLLGILNQIKDKDGKPYHFGFGFDAGGKNQSYSAIYEPFKTCAITPYGLLYRANAPELIDALYELTIFCIEHKYIQQ